MASDGVREPPVGILTRTLIASPVVRFLLHARIRHRSYNDLVFVGEDSVSVKQVVEGHLEHVATKDDFQARIRAAKVLNVDLDTLEDELLVKADPDASLAAHTAIPPEILVLTLDTNDVVFLYLAAKDGEFQFVHQALPMPTFDRILFQPGEHLAIDPHSRALAVAATEKEVIIYSAKSHDRIKHELRTSDADWCPVSAQRPLQVDGVIQHVEFLFPPSDDEDRIILLLIVTDQRRTKAILIDWYYSSDLHHAQVHPGQPLDSAKTISSLLVPLRNASFLMITGNEVKRWKDILTGVATGTTLSPLDSEPWHSGTSPRRPVWASWCRPRRSQAARRDKDHFYLVREDGLVFLIQVMSGSIQSSSAGHFQCHVGTAFASLGDDQSPDVLAVAGEMSTGRVVSIGQWPTNGGRVSDLSWYDTMEMDLIETIPNWASVSDLVTSSLPVSHGRAARTKDGVFVTSGRQPYGAVTELRQGLEARLVAYFQLEGLQTVNALWALPIANTESVLVLLATPSATRMFDIDANLEPTELGHDDGLAIDTQYRTLAAATLPNNYLLQVTERGVCLTASLTANFEDTITDHCGDCDAIIAAAIEPAKSLVVTAEKTGPDFRVRCIKYHLPSQHDGGSGDDPTWKETITSVEAEPLAVALTRHLSGTIVALALADGRVQFLTIANDDEVAQAGEVNLTGTDANTSISDHIAILRTDTAVGLLVVCGLRDGRICTISLVSGESGVWNCNIQQTLHLGLSTVKLVPLTQKPSSVFAMTGGDTCLLSWTGESSSGLEVQSIWTSDKSRPELAQPPILACVQMSSADVTVSADMAGLFAMVTGDEFLIASLGISPGIVPRQIPVNGTPNRLVYAEQQRSFVCASVRAELRSFPTPSSRPEERRQIWPVIDFIPARNDSPSYTHHFEPGERVYALLEWSFRLTEDKVYSFILVGGSYIRTNGSSRGRVTFLQPMNRNWDIVGVKEGQATSFDAPVYALALYDELTYVACYGEYVVLNRFSKETRKWADVCEPFKLASAGVYVTVEAPLVHITTASDAMIVLRLTCSQGDDEGDGKVYRLVPVSTTPQVAYGLSHLVLDLDEARSPALAGLTLMSTKYGQVIGLSSPPSDKDVASHSDSARILFEAQLLRSLTRIRRANVRPKWKLTPPTGVIANDIVGVSADGTVTGIALLDRDLWRRLSWLHRVCEWSEQVSPHAFQSPSYSVEERSYGRDERGLPIGLGASSTRPEDIILRTSSRKPHDMHIDGDVLARVLQKGGEGILREIIKRTAERDDRIGAWLKTHLQAELEAVDEMVNTLRRLLDGWL